MDYIKYIDKFETAEDIQTALDNGELNKPYVAQVSGDGYNYIDWNELEPTPPLSAQPLTFEIISGGTIMWTAKKDMFGWEAKELHYSINGGTWETILSSSAGTPINVVAGDKVAVKANGIPGTVLAQEMSTFLGSTCYFNLKGNVASMVDENNYQTLTVADSTKTRLNYLFQGTNVVDASKLILPYTSFTVTDVYYAMFQGCTRLTIAPELPPATLGVDSIYSNMFAGCTSLTRTPKLSPISMANYGFYNMFSGCTNLNYVECLCLPNEITSYNWSKNWLSGVAANGTFVKHPNATWETGINGIPENWTVIDADI